MDKPHWINVRKSYSRALKEGTMPAFVRRLAPLLGVSEMAAQFKLVVAPTTRQRLPGRRYTEWGFLATATQNHIIGLLLCMKMVISNYQPPSMKCIKFYQLFIGSFILTHCIVNKLLCPRLCETLASPSVTQVESDFRNSLSSVRASG